MNFQPKQVKIGHDDMIQMPLLEWQKIAKKYKKMEEKLSFEKRFRHSLKEIRLIEAGIKHPKTMQQFLDEL
jgi:hypothetical protein